MPKTTALAVSNDKFATKELEKHMQKWNQAIEESQNILQTECQEEIEALKKAQRKYQEKIQSVMRSQKMKDMESRLFEAEEKTNQYVRRMQREFDQMLDEVEFDPKLSKDEKNKEQAALAKTARDEFVRLNDKYPAAMKAHVLSNLSGGIRMITQ